MAKAKKTAKAASKKKAVSSKVSAKKVVAKKPTKKAAPAKGTSSKKAGKIKPSAVKPKKAKTPTVAKKPSKKTSVVKQIKDKLVEKATDLVKKSKAKPVVAKTEKSKALAGKTSEKADVVASPAKSDSQLSAKEKKAAATKKVDTKKRAKVDEIEIDDFDDDLGGEEELEAIPELADFDDEDGDDIEISLVSEEPDYVGAQEDIILTDAEGRRYCRVRDCDQIANVDGYCRYHYLLFWKKIQIRSKILSDGKLKTFIEELTSRYPDKYLEMIKKDLRTEKDFLAAIQELEIDESALDNEYEDEAQTFIQEVRGVSDSGHRDDDDF